MVLDAARQFGSSDEMNGIRHDVPTEVRERWARDDKALVIMFPMVNWQGMSDDERLIDDALTLNMLTKDPPIRPPALEDGYIQVRFRQLGQIPWQLAGTPYVIGPYFGKTD